MKKHTAIFKLVLKDGRTVYIEARHSFDALAKFQHKYPTETQGMKQSDVIYFRGC